MCVQSVSMFQKLNLPLKAGHQSKYKKKKKNMLQSSPSLSVCIMAQIHTKWDSGISQFTVEIFKGTFCNISYCIVN